MHDIAYLKKLNQAAADNFVARKITVHTLADIPEGSSAPMYTGPYIVKVDGEFILAHIKYSFHAVGQPKQWILDGTDKYGEPTVEYSDDPQIKGILVADLFGGE